jgi:hypothetical protein
LASQTNERNLAALLEKYDDEVRRGRTEIEDITDKDWRAYRRAQRSVIRTVLEDVGKRLAEHGVQYRITVSPTRIMMVITFPGDEMPGALWYWFLPKTREVLVHFEGGRLGSGSGGAASIPLDAVTPEEVEYRAIVCLAPLLLPPEAMRPRQE